MLMTSIISSYTVPRGSIVEVLDQLLGIFKWYKKQFSTERREQLEYVFGFPSDSNVIQIVLSVI